MVGVTYLPCFGCPVALERLGNVVISSQIKVQLLGTHSFELQENVSCIQDFPSGCTAVSHTLSFSPFRDKGKFEDGLFASPFLESHFFLGLLMLLVNEIAR